jgi:hypothetical protein
MLKFRAKIGDRLRLKEDVNGVPAGTIVTVSSIEPYDYGPEWGRILRFKERVPNLCESRFELVSDTPKPLSERSDKELADEYRNRMSENILVREELARRGFAFRKRGKAVTRYITPEDVTFVRIIPIKEIVL